jgi:hypothetical protein
MKTQIINEWRQFLKESPVPEEVSDEVLKLIFSSEIDEILEKGTLNEGLASRAQSLAKRYGIPVALAMSVLTGGITAKEFAQLQNSDNTPHAAEVDQHPAGSMARWRSGSKPPGYSDLSNTDSIEKSWEDIADLPRARAPVSGVAPVMIKGRMKMMGFSYIPASELSPETILPMSLMPAESYRLMLEERLERRPNELIHLKNMIFGDTGKWASGSGNEIFRVEGNSALLPPEWSIAHEVYARAIEARLIEMVDYVRDHPDTREDIFQQLGVTDEAQFHEFVNDQLFKIGRQ